MKIYFLFILLFSSITYSAFALTPNAFFTTVITPDSTFEMRSARTETGFALALDEIEKAFSVTVVRPTELPILILATRMNSQPVFKIDKNDYLIADGFEYVRAENVASACGCKLVQMKKDWQLHCGNVMRADSGGAVGSIAPGFKLNNENDSLVSSLELLEQGPLIVSFVRSPSWEPLSRDLIKRLDANRETFDSAKVSLVAITGYVTEEIRDWNDSVKVSFPILADNSMATMICFGVYQKARLPYPSVFLIDREGIIRYRELFDGLEAPDMSGILQAVKDL